MDSPSVSVVAPSSLHPLQRSPAPARPAQTATHPAFLPSLVMSLLRELSCSPSRQPKTPLSPQAFDSQVARGGDPIRIFFWARTQDGWFAHRVSGSALVGRSLEKARHAEIELARHQPGQRCQLVPRNIQAAPHEPVQFIADGLPRLRQPARGGRLAHPVHLANLLDADPPDELKPQEDLAPRIESGDRFAERAFEVLPVALLGELDLGPRYGRRDLPRRGVADAQLRLVCADDRDRQAGRDDAHPATERPLPTVLGDLGDRFARTDEQDVARVLLDLGAKVDRFDDRRQRRAHAGPTEPLEGGGGATNPDSARPSQKEVIYRE